MAIPKFTENVNNITSIVGNTPTITAAELKALFDKAGVDLKTYTALLANYLESNAAASDIGAAPIEGLTG